MKIILINLQNYWNYKKPTQSNTTWISPQSQCHRHGSICRFKECNTLKAKTHLLTQQCTIAMPKVKFQTTCRLKFQSYRHLHVQVGILAFSLIVRGMRICKVALLDVFSYSNVLFFVCPCVNLLGMGDIGSFFLELRILISSACYYRLIGICQGEQQKSYKEMNNIFYLDSDCYRPQQNLS
jgi:hypothetical protein